MAVFSVCIPTKNRATTHLKELLASLEKQILPTGWSLEIVICDDGSNSNELFSLKKLIDRSLLDIVLIIHKKSLGIAAARNNAVRASSGELIADVDDDDILPIDSVQQRIIFHANNPDYKWSFGSAHVVDKNLRYKIGRDLVPSWDTSQKNIGIITKNILQQEIFYWASTRTYRRDALFHKGELIEWDSQFTVAEDLDHWVQLVKKIGVPAHIQNYLVIWREKKYSCGIDGKRSGLQKIMVENIVAKHS